MLLSLGSLKTAMIKFRHRSERIKIIRHLSIIVSQTLYSEKMQQINFVTSLVEELILPMIELDVLHLILASQEKNCILRIWMSLAHREWITHPTRYVLMRTRTIRNFAESPSQERKYFFTKHLDAWYSFQIHYEFTNLPNEWI